VTLADKVTAALQASVLPSVIARGGEIRVLAVEDGTARLEVTGSPGAALPLLARIEALIRHAVPEVTRVVMSPRRSMPQATSPISCAPCSIATSIPSSPRIAGMRISWRWRRVGSGFASRAAARAAASPR